MSKGHSTHTRTQKKKYKKILSIILLHSSILSSSLSLPTAAWDYQTLSSPGPESFRLGGVYTLLLLLEGLPAWIYPLLGPGFPHPELLYSGPGLRSGPVFEQISKYQPQHQSLVWDLSVARSSCHFGLIFVCPLLSKNYF